MSTVSLSELLETLGRGDLVLLPNARAARQMRAEFNTRQRLRGLQAWEPARALSWGQWARSLWNELVLAGVEQRLLLNPAQEHLLWRQIIAEDTTNRPLGSVDSLVELAKSAWQLAGDYNATQQLRRFAGSHDSRVFAAWAEAFAARCRESDALDASLLNAALEEHVRRGTLALPASLDVAGFVEMLPSQRSLLNALSERGVEVREQALEDVEAARMPRVSLAAASEREEMVLAVRWIRGFLEERREKDQSARVALLLPSSTDKRAAMEGVLREILAPELQDIRTDLSSAPWEFSRGVALASNAMIADALAIVRWTQGAIPLQRAGSLLLSPYAGGQGASDDAREAAARFDVQWLRRMSLLRPEVELADVCELLARAEAAPRNDEGMRGLAWLREVLALVTRRGEMERPRGYAEWMEFVRVILVAAGWPGDRGLSATEFEATRTWESVLDTVATLDFGGRRVPFATALEALELKVRDASLTIPSTDAPVKVMSVSEAEGSFFDAAVLMQVTDTNWPGGATVHPLLPWAMQRTLKMPGSDAASSAARNREAMEALLRCTGPVLFTYAMEDSSGVLRPSPLLQMLGIAPVMVEELDLYEAATLETGYETVVDASALPALPSFEVGGGASVLKLQAACGFLAFAELRLRARAPETGELGLDAGETGSLLHRALQAFWRETKSQDALRAMSAAELEQAVVRAVDEAFPNGLRPRSEWDRSYLWIQRQRLRTLLRQWLPHELKRGPFTVSDVERKELVNVGPLTLEVRVDRVDSVPEGVFFVDYKTGFEVGPKQWEGPRPDDPQLPLYALLAEGEELKGVAFGRLRAGREMSWVGYQAEEGILPASRSKANVKEMTSLAAEWREMLDELASAFVQGSAEVSPKSYDKNCARCAQRLICRVDPAMLEESQDDAEENGEDEIG